MRILVHDYAGHPFQAQLSRELARRGHEVVHSFRHKTGGRGGALSSVEADPQSLSFVPVAVGAAASNKSGVLRRVRHELTYGRALTRVAEAKRPDAIISANTPLLIQRAAMRWARANGTTFIYWMQDHISVAQSRKLRRRFGIAGRPFGAALRRLEAAALRQSDAVVAVTWAFADPLTRSGVDPQRVTVIPNWAALDEMPVRDRDNSWALEQGLSGRTVFLYAGSLGLKHQPERLIELARALPDSRVVVVAEGSGADLVRTEAARLGLSNVLVLPSQPYDRLPEVLASADVLVALLDSAGGEYSVPSKILTYLCASRPILAAVPERNLAAQVVRDSGGGIVVRPDANDDWLATARRLAHSEDLRRELGQRGRAYAEGTFDIERIASQFEDVIDRARNHAT